MARTGARGGVVRLLALLLLAFLLAVLISLGLWQLQRAEEKALIQATFETRSVEPPLAVGATLLAADAFEYYRAEAVGTWDADRSILLDNRISAGRPGYHVITPLKLSGAETRLLVNRGWIPWSSSRSVVPAIESASGTVKVHGILKQPAEDFYTLESRPPRVGEPVWQNLDMKAYRSQVDYPLQPMVLLLDPAAEGGFLRAWPTVQDEWIARHRGYALQWFGLAVALVVLTFMLVWRSRKSRAPRTGERADD